MAMFSLFEPPREARIELTEARGLAYHGWAVSWQQVARDTTLGY